MGRRKNDDAALKAILKLGGLFILLSVLSPGVRNFVSALGTIFLFFLILFIVVLAGLVIYRIANANG